MLIELREHCTQLQNKATMVSSHVYGTLEGLSGRPCLGARVLIAIKPRLSGDFLLFLLQFSISLIQIGTPTSSWGWLSTQTLIVVFVLSLLLVGTRCLCSISDALIGGRPAATLSAESHTPFSPVCCRMDV